MNRTQLENIIVFREFDIEWHIFLIKDVYEGSVISIVSQKLATVWKINCVTIKLFATKLLFW